VLPEAANAAISCPVCAFLYYRYADIFKAVPSCPICPVMFFGWPDTDYSYG